MYNKYKNKYKKYISFFTCMFMQKFHPSTDAYIKTTCSCCSMFLLLVACICIYLCMCPYVYYNEITRREKFYDMPMGSFYFFIYLLFLFVFFIFSFFYIFIFLCFHFFIFPSYKYLHLEHITIFRKRNIFYSLYIDGSNQVFFFIMILLSIIGL